jgi:hypothetical protein
MSQQGGKKDWQPKYSNKVQYSEFKTDFGTHHMMHIPLNVNEDTGYGKMKGYGLSQLRALMKPENLIAIRAHMERYPEEGVVQIKVDDHVGKEFKTND